MSMQARWNDRQKEKANAILAENGIEGGVFRARWRQTCKASGLLVHVGDLVVKAEAEGVIHFGVATERLKDENSRRTFETREEAVDASAEAMGELQSEMLKRTRARKAPTTCRCDECFYQKPLETIEDGRCADCRSGQFGKGGDDDVTGTEVDRV